MSKLKDLSGVVFGRLTVGSRVPNVNKHTRWECLCECGNRKDVDGTHLLSGKTRSCGCYNDENRKINRLIHGQGKAGEQTPEYLTWARMKARCLNTKSKDYPDYGGRGITICEEWKQYEPFFIDMGPKPSPDHSLDRIDNSQGYNKYNCRWATNIEQCRNRRTNTPVEYRGIMYPSITALADIAPKYLKPVNVVERLQSGWSVEDAMNRPLHYKRPKNKQP